MRETVMTNKTLCTLLCCLSLAGCAGRPTQASNIARYDLPASGQITPVSQLRSIEVGASPWLLSDAMHYRLAYADGNRREQFATSRWSAQPAQLLNVRLQRALVGSSGQSGTTCHVHLMLDDLVQVFDSPTSSQVLLEGRATLYGLQQSVLARKTLRLDRPAGASAQTGVAAGGELLSELSRELRDWVRAECR